MSQRTNLNNINESDLPYSINLLNTVMLPENFQSTIFKMNDQSVLLQLSKIVIKRLVFNLPLTPNEISIAADKSPGNPWQLNIHRPGVLRQVYGLDIRCCENNIVQRYAYGLGANTTSEGTDPCRVTVKPFCEELKLMSLIFNKV